MTDETGKMHIPKTPPKATTAQETDRALHDVSISDLDKILSILNENEGKLTPYLFAELDYFKSLHPEIKYTDKNIRFALLSSIAYNEPEGLEILERARNNLKRDIKEKQAERAEAARQKQKTALIQTQGNASRRIKYNNTDTFTFLKDSFTKEAFSIAPEFRNENGKQVLYAVFKTKDKKKSAIKLKSTFTYDIEYLAAVGITDAKIDPGYDRAVCTVCDNLYLNGNTRVSLSKILKELGIRYSQKEAAKLLQTLRKLKSINLIVDNKAVLELYGIGDKYKEIDRPFLPISIEHDRMLIRGNISETTIEIMGFTAFWLVADPISQKTEYEKELFALYSGRRTSKYWRVLVSLMDEIAYLRSGARQSKFLLSSICDEVGDEDNRQRDATKKLVYELLEQVFIPLQYIDSYQKSETGDFFIVSWSRDRKPAPRLNATNK